MPTTIGRCGGGGLTRFNGVYSGNNVNAAGGGGAVFVGFDTLDSGDAVLASLGNHPTVTKTGYYVVTVVAGGAPASTFAVGATVSVQLDMTDSGGPVISPHGVSGPASVAITPPLASVCAALWLTAGSTIDVLVTNGDAANQDVYLDQAVVAFLGGS